MNDPDSLLPRLLQSAPLLEAIAEEQNFTRAAQRLGVEQSAVSHRIKALEAALGMPLFDRTTRRITPTEAGRIVCGAAQQSGGIWQAALLRLQDLKTSRSLRLSVSSSVAMKWIVPALQRAQDGGLDLLVDVDDRLADLHAGEAKAAIRYGMGPYPGLHSEPLLQAVLLPVCRPGYLGRQSLQDYCRQPGARLLVDRFGESDGTGFSWQAYFAGRGWDIGFERSINAFARADLAIQAAISGMGIALGRSLLVEHDLEAGFLEAAGAPVKSRARYWLVTTPANAATEGYQALRSWLQAEVSEMRKQQAALFKLP
ncbi:LysR family transcriptional regulator [Leisingera caerulea]|uniref:LysR family transcriptional regulator n=1 Tax=Leisingera caerulea TaxID=506591 RepID=UPI0021A8522F|nr:LysR family transcriptional regulator [Leisingera caerulea]UWQ49109.1 LysR family transcriptional regulator [Leisingera caerulea]